MTKKDYFSFNHFSYKVEIYDLINNSFDFRLNYPECIEKPKTLYQYFSLEDFHLKSIEEQYFYARHPEEFNDLLDSSYSLIDCSSVPDKEIMEFLLESEVTPTDIDTLKLYPRKLRQEYLYELYNQVFGVMGIISMTEKYNDILMWAYYNKNKGFAIGYNLEDCSLHTKNELIGPFPINYSVKLKKIDLNKYTHLSRLVQYNNFTI